MRLVCLLLPCIFGISSYGLPNLLPYHAPNWSDKIVASTTRGTTTESTLTTADTIYIDFAIANLGSRSTGKQFLNTLFVDGTVKQVFAYGALEANLYIWASDFSIGTLSEGDHTIRIVVDSGIDVSESEENDNSYTKTITVVRPPQQYPNLVPFIPTGWTDKIIVSKSMGATSDSPDLTTDDFLYVSWAVANIGQAATGGNFYNTLYLDGNVLQASFFDASLSAGIVAQSKDNALGKLSAGMHTLRIVADSGFSISESDNDDNSFTKTITVSVPKVMLTLKSLPNGSGTIIATPWATPDEKYSKDTKVSLRPVASVGNRFLLWTGDASGTADPLELNMTADKTITAVFERVNTHLSPSFSLVSVAHAAGNTEIVSEVQTRSTWRYLIVMTVDFIRWFLIKVFDGDDSTERIHTPVQGWETIRVETIGAVPIDENGLNLKMPLQAGRSWRLTTEIGDQGCNASANGPTPSHSGLNYFSLDFDPNRWSEQEQKFIDESNHGKWSIPVFAAAGGIVVEVNYQERIGTNQMNGWYVVINHNYRPNTDGYTTRYIHLKEKPLVSTNQVVRQGLKIGYMGNTGTDEVHLHFSVRFNNSGGSTVDALKRVRIEDLTLDQYVAKCNQIGPTNLFPSSNVEFVLKPSPTP